MKIVALVTDAFGGYGGIAQYNRDLLGALDANPAVSRLTVLPRIAPDAVTVGLSPKSRQLPPCQDRLRYAAEALRLVLAERPDVIFCGHVYHGALALALARLTKAKLVQQLHGTEVWGKLEPRRAQPLEKANLILTVSRDTRRRALAQASIAPERCIVVSNTVGPEFNPGDRRAARRKWAAEGNFVISTVARLDGRDGYKGHDRVISTLPRLLQAGVSVMYIIAGSGDDRPRLEALVRSLGLDGQVHFAGKVAADALPDLYRASDLFALPSTGEGFGIAYLEAMACGTPAIGLAVGGAPDALGDGELGLCVPEGSFPDALVRAACLDAPDPERLSQAVALRFGQTAFRARVAQAISALA